MNTWKWLCLCALSFACGWFGSNYHQRHKPVDREAIRQTAEQAFDALAAEEELSRTKKEAAKKAIMELPVMDLSKEEAAPEKPPKKPQ